MSPSEKPLAAPVAVPSAATALYHAKTYRFEESIGYLMHRIVTSLAQSIERDTGGEPGGPTFPQWKPLHKLHMGRATTVAELARECQLDTGAMTRLLDRLEAKGLCRRVRSLADRRVVNIELTPEGLAAAQEVPHVLCRVLNQHLTGFSAEELAELKGYLHRILDNAQSTPVRGETNETSAS
ncbi:MAG: MarR family transcriptional regulator [Rhodoferax sp.]